MEFTDDFRKRFWSRVNKSGDCWLWTGGKDNGYGVVFLNGRILRAHRVAYEMTVGPIPDGLLACHHCDVRSCVRPGHIFLGTHGDNLRDAQAKGRLWNRYKGKSQLRDIGRHRERMAKRTGVCPLCGGHYAGEVGLRQHMRMAGEHTEPSVEGGACLIRYDREQAEQATASD